MRSTKLLFLVTILGLATLLGCTEDLNQMAPVASVIPIRVEASDYVMIGDDQVPLDELETLLRKSVAELDTYVVLDIAPEAAMSVVLSVTHSIGDAGVQGTSNASLGRQVFHRPVIRAQ